MDAEDKIGILIYCEFNNVSYATATMSRQFEIPQEDSVIKYEFSLILNNVYQRQKKQGEGSSNQHCTV